MLFVVLASQDCGLHTLCLMTLKQIKPVVFKIHNYLLLLFMFLPNNVIIAIIIQRVAYSTKSAVASGVCLYPQNYKRALFLKVLEFNKFHIKEGANCKQFFGENIEESLPDISAAVQKDAQIKV